jgi:RNase H-fold protein (predicted Holliday junction resolvase)
VIKPVPPILAVDPGSDKIGVARVNADGGIAWRRIVPRSQIERALAELAAQPPEVVVVGDGTTSRAMVPMLKRTFGEEKVQVVDESHSTLEARAIYFADHPPTGLWRLVPLSMQMPAEPIDDYAAVVLARRYLAGRR